MYAFLLFVVLISHLPPTTSVATGAGAATCAAHKGIYGYGDGLLSCPANHIPQRSRSKENAVILELHKMVTSYESDQLARYFVTVGLGGHNAALFIDTGSDLTWVQCEPCYDDPPEPIFNPSQSPSYKLISCWSTTCKNIEYATGDCGTSSPSCNYYVRYEDGSYSHGHLATDHLLLGTTLVKDFVFGCGRVSYGLCGQMSGLLGLARSDLSLVGVFGGVFSYCLPSWFSEGSGWLMLGDDPSLYKNETPVSYTNLILNTKMPRFYFVNLTGISIDGVSLQDPSFGHDEILIDSGTAITRLKPTVYHAVKTEFLRRFVGFPKAPAYSILDTCFNLSAYKELNLELYAPEMELHFGADAKFTVYGSGLLYFVSNDMSHVCLAIACSSDEISVLGGYQQTNKRIVYNTKASTFGFAEEIC